MCVLVHFLNINPTMQLCMKKCYKKNRDEHNCRTIISFNTIHCSGGTNPLRNISEPHWFWLVFLWVFTLNSKRFKVAQSECLQRLLTLYWNDTRCVSKRLRNLTVYMHRVFISTRVHAEICLVPNCLLFARRSSSGRGLHHSASAPVDHIHLYGGG